MLIDIKNNEEFVKELNCSGVVLVDFWATWCNPCRMQASIVHDLEKELGNKIKVLKVDVDEDQKTAINYGIMSIPTLMVFKGGEEKEKIVGLTALEELKKVVEKYL